MTEDLQTRSWRGFSGPLSANGEHQLYGPPPWRFEGYAAAVRLQCRRADVAAMVPTPLDVRDDPIVELGIFDCVCDHGLGEKFVQRNPDLAHFREGFARHIHAPELQYLRNALPIGGRWHTMAWTKPYPEEIIADSIEAA